jgi:hypothetical protein
MEPMVGAKNASISHRHQEGHHRRHHQKPGQWCAMEEFEFDSGIILTEDY